MAFETFDRLIAIIIRGFLVMHNFLLIWRLKEATDSSQIWFMSLTNLAIVLEGFYFVFERNGKEMKWISPLFVIFLLCELPSVWLLELNNFDLANAPQEAINTTATRNGTINVDIVEQIIGDIFTADTWVLMLEETTLYMLVISRWLLPHGALSRAMLSEILLIYVGIASDVMEFFSLVSEDHIRRDLQATYLVLGVWSVSCFQFTYTIVLSRKKTRSRGVSSGENENEDTLAIETMSVILSFFMQDGPFLCVRLYIMIRFHLLTYSIVFFVIKNVIVVLFLGYRLVILCLEIKKRGKDPDTEKIIPIADFSVLHVTEADGDYQGFDKRSTTEDCQCEPVLPNNSTVCDHITSQYRDVSTNTEPYVPDSLKRRHSHDVRKRKPIKLPSNDDVVSYSKKNKNQHEVLDNGKATFVPLNDSDRCTAMVDKSNETGVGEIFTVPHSTKSNVDKELDTNYRPPPMNDVHGLDNLEARLLYLHTIRRRRRFHEAFPHSVHRKPRRRHPKKYIISL